MLWQSGRIESLKTKQRKTCTGRYGNTGERIVLQKETEKTLKYEDLCIDIQQMWNIKCVIVLVIIGAAEIILSLKGEFGSHTGKTFSRFTTDSCTISGPNFCHMCPPTSHINAFTTFF
jgi:hypothetical protein